MRAILLVLAGLALTAPAAGAAERLGDVGEYGISGPAVRDGHVAWGTGFDDAVAWSAPPARRARVLARFAGPADDPPLRYENAVEVLAGGARPVLLRLVFGTDTSAYQGSGGFDAGWELLAGTPLRRLRGAVAGDPASGPGTCPTGPGASDGRRVARQVVARVTPRGLCVAERAIEVVDVRSGAATEVLRDRSAARLRLAGRYLAFVDRTVVRARMPVVVYDLVARREAYRTPPLAADVTAMDVQADSKVVVVQAPAPYPERRADRSVVWFGPRNRRGRRLPVRAGDVASVRLVGDRVLLQRVRRGRAELAVVELAGRIRPLRGARRSFGDLGFDGRWAAWAGVADGRRGIWRQRVASR